MSAHATYKPCGETLRSAALLSLRTAVRVTCVCLAIVCCWADSGESGEETAGDRYFALAAPWSGAETGEPDALPEIPALPSAADRRNLWLSKTRPASVNRGPISFLLTAQPNPRSPPIPIATHAPARSLSPVFLAA